MAQDHILVVDDEPYGRKSLKYVLEDAGYKVTAVASGEEAVEILSKAQPANEVINLLITDVFMPQMTGIELLKVLKSRGIILPTLVISAFSDKFHTSEVNEMASCLEKPFNREVLLSAIHKTICMALIRDCSASKITNTTPAVVEDDDATILGCRNILLIEHDESTGSCLRNILETAGYFVEINNNGKGVVDALKKSGGLADVYDLIIADICRPEMVDTNLLIALTRRMPMNIPVLAITAFPEGAGELNVLDMSEFINKLFDKNMFIQLVGRCFENDIPADTHLIQSTVFVPWLYFNKTGMVDNTGGCVTSRTTTCISSGH